MPEQTPAAERLVEAAQRLFAEQGYERTNVGDLQEAVGLSRGSGALYKHFPSKQRLLEEIVERFIATAEHELAALDRPPGEGFEQWLRRAARAVLHSFEQERDALRIAWRELDAFPDLRQQVLDRRIHATFRRFSRWLEQQAEAGRLLPHDSDAVSTVMLGSLAFYKLAEALLGDRPAAVSERRLVDAWVTMFAGALTRAGDRA